MSTDKLQTSKRAMSDSALMITWPTLRFCDDVFLRKSVSDISYIGIALLLITDEPNTAVMAQELNLEFFNGEYRFHIKVILGRACYAMSFCETPNIFPRLWVCGHQSKSRSEGISKLKEGLYISKPYRPPRSGSRLLSMSFMTFYLGHQLSLQFKQS